MIINLYLCQDHGADHITFNCRLFNKNNLLILKINMAWQLITHMYVIPYMAERQLSADQNYIKLEWCIKC